MQKKKTPDSFEFTIQRPKSKKNSYRSYGSKIIKTAETKAQEIEIRMMAKQAVPQNWNQELACRVEIEWFQNSDTVNVMVKQIPGERPKRAFDLQNMIDVILDALEGVAYKNDRYVMHLDVLDSRAVDLYDHSS